MRSFPRFLLALSGLTLCVTMSLHATISHAQTWPARPVKLVVGFPPGGGVDINARLLAGKLTELLQQAVVVENKPGAGTNIANDFVAKSAPDGYTFLMNTSSVAINMSLYKDLPFNTLRDFAPVSVFSDSQNILVVNAAKAFKSTAEVISAARAKPGALTYGSAGAGSTQHLTAELFKLQTKSDILHIPYKGSAPALTALMSGEVDMVFINVPAILQHVKSGRLRPLAAAGGKRSEIMPEVPMLKEAGVNLGWRSGTAYSRRLPRPKTSSPDSPLRSTRPRLRRRSNSACSIRARSRSATRQRSSVRCCAKNCRSGPR